MAECPLQSGVRDYFPQGRVSIGKIGQFSTGKMPAWAESGLAFTVRSSPFSVMGLPNQPVTLSVEQIAELNRKLSIMRHDINNNLSLILAAVELARYKPETAERMMATLSEQPPRITAKLSEFSAEFEQAVGITRT